ncbi:hypothetical protein DIURU_004413 [Diutina rugosa]|uniref:Uncharacterized protein n=1 Tax=Diutina rugosa TaxID=5481 RepID=A0A642UHN1_DIURU|nr:uncharacterized protein DIURU_004413 [Diutina rugosa]KAA8899231.1 hypothetical protein DIURU_004413 [Diutina rugosa]
MIPRLLTPKRVILLVVVVPLIWLAAVYYRPAPAIVHLLGDTKYPDHPVYRRWKYRNTQNFTTIGANALCGEYFHALGPSYAPQPPPAAVDFLVYDRDRYLWEHIKNHKMEHGVTGNYKQAIADGYAKHAKVVADAESEMVASFSHMRVWGHCSLYTKLEDVNHVVKYGKVGRYDHKLFPWLTQLSPLFNQSYELPITDGNKPKMSTQDEGWVQHYLRRSNGRGVVVYANNDTAASVPSLITVLRLHQNELPIQIVSMGPINLDYEAIEQVAQGPFEPPKSFSRYLKVENLRKPESFLPQSITYVDVAPAVHNVSHDSLRELAAIFTSFEEYVLLSPLAIPTVPPSSFFDIEGYSDKGMHLYHQPNYLEGSNSPQTGREEVERLLHRLTPSDIDSVVFGFDPSEFPTTKLDDTVAVLNKNKVLSGLLISVNLRRHPLVKAVDIDLFWLGQHISGVPIQINVHPAVAAGVVSDDSHKTKDAAMAEELCSSSWGQLSRQDHPELFYLTGHQMVNWHRQPSFATQIKQRVGQSEPMAVEVLLKPPTVNKPVPVKEEHTEPNRPWIKQNQAEGQPYAYWCAYSILGSPAEDHRGVVISISPIKKARYRYLLDAYGDVGNEAK